MCGEHSDFDGLLDESRSYRVRPRCPNAGEALETASSLSRLVKGVLKCVRLGLPAGKSTEEPSDKYTV